MNKRKQIHHENEDEEPPRKKTTVDTFLRSTRVIEALKLTNLKIGDLRKMCKERNLTYNGKPKHCLIEKLLDHMEQDSLSPLIQNNSPLIDEQEEEEPVEELKEEIEIIPTTDQKSFVKKLKEYVADMENVISIDFGATHISVTILEDGFPTTINSSFNSHTNTLKTRFYMQKTDEKNYRATFGTDAPNDKYDMVFRIKQMIGFGLSNSTESSDQANDYNEQFANTNTGVSPIEINVAGEKVVFESGYIYKKMISSVLMDLKERGLFNDRTKFLISCPNQYSVKQSQNTFPKMFNDAAMEVLNNWIGSCHVFNESSCAITQTMISKRELKNSMLIDIGDSSVNITSTVVSKDNKIQMFHSGSLFHGAGYSLTRSICDYVIKKEGLVGKVNTRDREIIESNIDEWKPNLCDPNYKEDVSFAILFKRTSLIGRISQRNKSINSKIVCGTISSTMFAKIESLINEHSKTYNVQIPDNIIYCGGGMNNVSLTKFLGGNIFHGKNISMENTSLKVGTGLFYRYALENIVDSMYKFEDFPPFSIYTCILGINPKSGENVKILRKILGKTELLHNTVSEEFDIEPYTFFPLIQVNSVKELIYEDENPNLELISFGEVHFEGVIGRNLSIKFESEWCKSKLKFSVNHNFSKYPGTFLMNNVREKKLMFKNFKLQ
jgi:hypothetical protein